MPEPSAEEEPIVDDLSTFQKVTAEVTGGCQCACHTGIGSATSCEHCWRPGMKFQWSARWEGNLPDYVDVTMPNGDRARYVR